MAKRVPVRSCSGMVSMGGMEVPDTVAVRTSLPFGRAKTEEEKCRIVSGEVGLLRARQIPT